MTIPEIENYLERFRVGIAGAGGLGSNCAAALARCGVGTLVLCDFDIIEEKNLSRQFYFSDQTGRPKVDGLAENILRIRPAMRVITYRERLDTHNIPVIFEGCDVIVEAFDLAEMKEMIVETVQQKMPGTPLVIGSGMAGWGDSGSIRCRKIDESLYVCGDETKGISDDLPPLAPRVGIVANMQANTVLEILMNLKK